MKRTLVALFLLAVLAMPALAKAEGSPVASLRTPEYYKKRPCPELVRLAANILDEYIAAHPLPEKK